MSKVFISYSRQSQDVAKNLVQDVQALGYVVWFDQELSGGHAWWDQILGAIRDSDIFVFLLDPGGLNSVACEREFGYAAALGKPILPVLVADGVSTNLLPPELSRLQFIDYRKQDRHSAFALGRALAGVPAASALPDPLPVPPEVPVSYLGGLTRKIETAAGLSYEEQSALVLDLRRGVRDPKTADDSRVLLRKLRARRDAFVAIAEEIDELLGVSRSAKEDRREKPVPKPEPVRIPRAEAPTSPVAPAASAPRARSFWYFLVPALVVIAGIGYFIHARGGSADDYWSDPATGLMWAKQESRNMNQPDAAAYCGKLRLGSYADWRLPTIDQLNAIRDGAAAGRTKGGLKVDLTGWEWSSSPGNDAGHMLAYPFDMGVAMSFVTTASDTVRALCVRGTEVPSSGVKAPVMSGASSVPPNPAAIAPIETWVDPATQLMWTKHDNGTNFTQTAALQYCGDLRLGGFADWKLPTIDQLAAIHDTAKEGTILGGIYLTQLWQWSSSPGEKASEALGFNFYGATRYSFPKGGISSMALCVRVPGNGPVGSGTKPSSVPDAGNQTAGALAVSNAYWVDPTTGLVWTKKDNGSRVDWNTADRYCTNFRIAGYADWKLPTIGQLNTIYDRSIDGHVRGGLRLAGNWYWTSDLMPGGTGVLGWDASGGWDFNSGVGNNRDGTVAQGRALCVRGGGK